MLSAYFHIYIFLFFRFSRLSLLILFCKGNLSIFKIENDLCEIETSFIFISSFYPTCIMVEFLGIVFGKK